MSNNNGQNENFFENLDVTEREIYNALIELGWILPRNEEELRRAEKSLESVECPPFPPELEDPAPLIERLRKEEEENSKSNALNEPKERSPLRLVVNNKAISETDGFTEATLENETPEIEDDAPSFPALLHRDISDETPSVVAENLGVTRDFLKLISDNRKFIPNAWREELVKEAKKKYSIDEARSRRTLTDYYSHQQIAASRAAPYSNRKMDWREILQKSKLRPDREAHYRLLAEEEEKQK